MVGDSSFGGIEDIFNQLLGGVRQPERGFDNSRETNNFLLSSIDTAKKKILIFDFSGKKIDSVEIVEESGIDEYGERVYTGNKILKISYDGTSSLKYALSGHFKRKNIDYSFTNGILEVVLKK